MILGICLINLSILGCSSSNESNHSPQNSTPITTLPTDGAPAVISPLDISAAEKDPCGIASKQQIESFGDVLQNIKQESTSGSFGPSCTWDFGRASSLLIGPPPPGRTIRGLSDIYQKGKANGFLSFSPTTIANYPAVVIDRSRGNCDIVIGLRDTQIYNILYSANPDSPNWGIECEVTRKAGEFLIEYLKIHNNEPPPTSN